MQDLKRVFIRELKGYNDVYIESEFMGSFNVLETAIKKAIQYINEGKADLLIAG